MQGKPLYMDETPAYFDIVPGRTIDTKGQKSILITLTVVAKSKYILRQILMNWAVNKRIKISKLYCPADSEPDNGSPCELQGNATQDKEDSDSAHCSDYC